MHIDDRVILHEYMASAIAGAGTISPFLVMQHLPGTEWSVDCLCDNGGILAGFVRSKRKHSQLIDANPVLMNLAGRVAKQFKLSNLVNIQFKSASKEEDDPHILEINPRMSGGCSYGALAGVNLPWLQLLHASGQLTPADLPVVRTTLAATISQAIDITPAGGIPPESRDYA
jgi:molybdopterin-guanine dinucleotide biosynthesis protein A